MVVTFDIPETMYKHLARIAEEELGNNSQEAIATLLRENLNDVFARSTHKRFSAEKAISPKEALAILAKYGTNAPEEYDRLP
jgi:hypothetical protein